MAADELYELETDDEFDDEFEGETDDEFESGNEDSELEMAEMLMELESDEELDQFLGKVWNSLGSGAKRLWNSPAGVRFRNVTRPFVQKALPKLGAAAGTALGGYLGPIGARLGARLGQAGGNWLGSKYELEVSYEMELETARNVVRVLNATAKKLVKNPQQCKSSRGVTHALKTTVDSYMSRYPHSKQRHGRTSYSSGPSNDASSGRWMRRGNKIILYGV